MPVRRRNGTWHYRFWLNGHEYTGATDLADTERNRNAAMRIEAEKRKLVQTGKVEEVKLQVMPFTKAAEMFIDWCLGEYREHPNSAKRIATSFASATVFFKGKAVSGITSGDLEDYKGWRRSAHKVKEITLRHDLHALSVFFQYAMRHGWCFRNVIETVEVPSDLEAVRMHVLDAREETLYFATCKMLATGAKVKQGRFSGLNRSVAATQYQALHDAARLILLQGARPEEVMSARVEDVSGDHWQIPRGKSSSARRKLRLTAEARGILEGRKMAAVNGWLFPGKTEGHVKTFQRAHDAVLKDCKLAFVLYDLRHTFATRAAAAGMPVTTLAATLGHANLRTVMKYVHVRQEDIDAGMKIMEAAIAADKVSSKRVM